MKTTSVMIIGFIIVLSIFGISSITHWQLFQDIEHISQYHKDMSIPAITYLQEIKSHYQRMHFTVVQILQSQTENEETHAKYQKQLENLDLSLQKYDSLAFVKDSAGVYLAPSLMRDQMKNYVTLYRNAIEEHCNIYQQFKNGEMSKNEAFEKLELFEKEFHQIIEENTMMEINGIDQIQNNIIDIEQRMESIFIISTITAIVVATIVVMLISKFVSNPINQLINMTKKISEGKFVKIEKKYNNSDVNEILNSLNKMSEDLEKYKSKILKQEKLSSIGELSSRLAHDIRNPLTVIKGTLDFIKMKNQNLTPEDIDRFDRVDIAIYRMTHQIDNVLDFIKGKPLKLSRQPLQEIIDSALLDITKPENIIIETKDTDIEIECDAEAMKIVLINLVVNAIQSIETNGVIIISSELKDDKVIITVHDSGPEISDTDLENIFEPLYTTKQEGTGLGLASCKSLVEQHHGTISAYNNPKRFEIELPQISKNSKY
ncbi:ATP-binding protein [Nitrosopumilus sp. S4]